MWEKARYFKDEATANKILETPNPRENKKLGRQVKGFVAEDWMINSFTFMVAVNLAKYRQNSGQKKALFSTGERIFVEASPYDKIWGIGIGMDDDDCLDEHKWKGMNLLGRALTYVRNELIVEETTSNFYDRQRARQLHSFEGMTRRSNLKATDIDGFQEYNGKLFIYFEGKTVGKRMETAQGNAFVSMCEILEGNPDQVKWVLHYEHDTLVEEDVIVKDQYVVNVLSSVYPEWRTPQSSEVVPKFELDSNGKLTVLDAIIQIEKWCHDNKIKIGGK